MNVQTTDLIKIVIDLFIIPLCVVMYRLDRSITDLRIMVAEKHVTKEEFKAHVADLWKGINELREKIRP